MSTSTARTKFSPPTLAARWGLDKAKIIGWIRSGELRAINAAAKRGGRPRYLIDVEDIQAFEQVREVLPACPQRRVRRNRHTIVKKYV
ncbi:MAG: helix-turn-helix domain-containing protein [Thermoguttaceae bacterium]|jgi:transposase